MNTKEILKVSALTLAISVAVTGCDYADENDTAANSESIQTLEQTIANDGVSITALESELADDKAAIEDLQQQLSELQKATTKHAVDPNAPKNIIFMVPDGMGMAYVTATRAYLNGVNGDPLSFEKLPYIGYQRSHARNAFVTDSAAAAAAWAAGEKFNNGEISCLDDNVNGECDGTRKNVRTILEIAADNGYETGLVATSDITHATPAAFGAHVHNRKCESTIFANYLENEIDVLLGGGIATNRSSCLLQGTDAAYNEAMVQGAVDNQGYRVVKTEADLLSTNNENRLIGLFNTGGLTPQYMKGAASTQPTLAQMADKALDVLEDAEKGFFLMVEGSQVDWSGHARNVPYMLGEMEDFANAVAKVQQWIAEDQQRATNTMLVVVGDHETGGYSVGTAADKKQVVEQGNSGIQATVVKDGTNGTTLMVNEDNDPVYTPNFGSVHGSNYQNMHTQSANHTAVDTIIWSNRPEFAKPMDNTDLFYIMKDFIEK